MEQSQAPEAQPSSGPSATDLITYIGIPLTVAGVVPLLWNIVKAFWIRRQLLKSIAPGLRSFYSLMADPAAGTVSVISFAPRLSSDGLWNTTLSPQELHQKKWRSKAWRRAKFEELRENQYRRLENVEDYVVVVAALLEATKMAGPLVRFLVKLMVKVLAFRNPLLSTFTYNKPSLLRTGWCELASGQRFKFDEVSKSEMTQVRQTVDLNMVLSETTRLTLDGKQFAWCALALGVVPRVIIGRPRTTMDDQDRKPILTKISEDTDEIRFKFVSRFHTYSVRRAFSWKQIMIVRRGYVWYCWGLGQPGIFPLHSTSIARNRDALICSSRPVQARGRMEALDESLQSRFPKATPEVVKARAQVGNPRQKPSEPAPEPEFVDRGWEILGLSLHAAVGAYTGTQLGLALTWSFYLLECDECLLSPAASLEAQGRSLCFLQSLERDGVLESKIKDVVSTVSPRSALEPMIAQLLSRTRELLKLNTYVRYCNDLYNALEVLRNELQTEFGTEEQLINNEERDRIYSGSLMKIDALFAASKEVPMRFTTHDAFKLGDILRIPQFRLLRSSYDPHCYEDPSEECQLETASDDVILAAHLVVGLTDCQCIAFGKWVLHDKLSTLPQLGRTLLKPAQPFGEANPRKNHVSRLIAELDEGIACARNGCLRPKLVTFRQDKTALDLLFDEHRTVSIQ